MHELPLDARQKLPDRMVSQIEVTDQGCWNWTGHCCPAGYGRYGGHQAMRRIWTILIGPIPAGRDLDHIHPTCERRCCAPHHLQEMSARLNRGKKRWGQTTSFESLKVLAPAQSSLNLCPEENESEEPDPF